MLFYNPILKIDTPVRDLARRHLEFDRLGLMGHQGSFGLAPATIAGWRVDLVLLVTLSGLAMISTGIRR